QLRDRQQIRDAPGQVEQLQAAALPAHGGIGADDLPEPGAIEVRHVGQVQHDLAVALVDQAVDLVLEQLVAFAERDLALEIEHHDVADRSFCDLHGHSGRWRRIYTKSSADRERGDTRGGAPPNRLGGLTVRL